jgi:hypothetical protein
VKGRKDGQTRTDSIFRGNSIPPLLQGDDDDDDDDESSAKTLSDSGASDINITLKNQSHVLWKRKGKISNKG